MKDRDIPAQQARFETLEPRLMLDVGGVWTELGFRAASGGGVSYATEESLRADMAIDANGYPALVWENGYNPVRDIYVAHFNGINWSPLGAGAASGGGIGTGHAPRIAVDKYSGTPYVAWVTGAAESTGTQIYLKYWDGSAWQELGGSASGGGISNDPVVSEEVTLAVGEDSLPVVAYRGYDEESNDWEIICKKWTGQIWAELTTSGPFPSTQGGLATYYGGGVSDDVFNSFNPSLAIGPDNAPTIAWASRAFAQDAEIYLRRWNGSRWETVGNSASDPGQQPVPGISNNAGESRWPYLLVGQDPDDPTAVTMIVGWLDYNNWLELGEAAVYMRQYNPDTDTWDEYTPGSATGNGLLGERAPMLDLDMALGVDSLPLLAYCRRWPTDQDGYKGFVMTAEDVGGSIVWTERPDAIAGVPDEISTAAQEVRWPRIEERPDGTPVVAYNNLLMDLSVLDPTQVRSGVITDEWSAGTILRHAPYDAYHMPLGVPASAGVAPIDSEILVSLWDDDVNDWVSYGPGSGELGGVENTLGELGEDGTTHNSPPQTAVDGTGAVLMSYLHRVADPANRYEGELKPRILRYSEQTGQWDFFPSFAEMPDLPADGLSEAPVYGPSDVFPEVDRDRQDDPALRTPEMDKLLDRSWYGDMLLISSDPKTINDMDGVVALAYVDAVNLDDPDPDVYGRTTITVFIYDTGADPDDAGDDFWDRLGTGTSGPDAYAYVAGGLVTDGWLVDQVNVISLDSGRVGLFWRQVDPTAVAPGLTQMLYDEGVMEIVESAETGSSEIFGLVWDSTTLQWAEFEDHIRCVSGGTAEMALIGDPAAEALGQSFLLRTTMSVKGVKLMLRQQGSVADNVYVEIQEDSGGSPSGTVVATSDLVAGDSLGSEFEWQEFDFGAPFDLAAGTYWLVLCRDGGPDAANYIEWQYNVSQAAYPNGGRGVLTDGAWTTDPTDALFDVTCSTIELSKSLDLPEQGINFSPTSVVTTTGDLVLTFTNASVQAVDSSAQDSSANPLPVPFIASTLVVFTHRPAVGWNRLGAPIAPTGSGNVSAWGPSIAVGLDGGPLPTWSAESQIPMMHDGGTTWIDIDYNPTMGDPGDPAAVAHVIVTGAWQTDTSFIQFDQWQPGGVWAGPADISTSGHSIMASAYGNGSQFPTVAWTDCDASAFEGLGYPFTVHGAFTPVYDQQGQFQGWAHAASTYDINFGAMQWSLTGDGVQSPYSSFDARQYYLNGLTPIGSLEYVEGTGGATPSILGRAANPATAPDTERIYVRRWNADQQAWEQLLWRDKAGTQHDSATGTGVSYDWAPGVMPDVVIHTVGEGTHLESQPVVVWSNIYEESIYAREWMHEGLTPFIRVLETSATVNDDQLEFGELYLTDEGQQFFTIANDGVADLFIEEILLDDPASFHVTDAVGQPLPSSFTIPKQGSVGILVHASPGELGPWTHFLQINSSDPVVPQYTLRLTGLRYSDAEIVVTESVGVVDDLVIPFNIVAEGETATESLIVQNVGTDDLGITQFAIGGVGNNFVPWIMAAQYMQGQDQGLAIYGGTGDSQSAAQGFSISTSRRLHTVRLYLARDGAPADKLYVEIQTDNAGEPSGTVLAGGVSTELAAGDVDPNDDGTYGWYAVRFPSRPSLDAGTTYWIVLRRTGARDDANYVTWGCDGDSATYANGQAAALNSGAWDTAGYADADALFAAGMLLTDDVILPGEARTVYVDFICDAASVDGVVAFGTIRHDDYQLRGMPPGRATNPIALVFTANKPDFKDMHVVASGAALSDPDAGFEAVTWLNGGDVEAQQLVYPVPSATPVATLSAPGAAAVHPRTDGQYIVWEDNNSIWMYDLATDTVTNLSGGLGGSSRWPNIDDGRVVFACDQAGGWDIYLVDIASGNYFTIPEAVPGLTDYYPDIDGDLIAWRSTPPRGAPDAPAETANTDKIVFAYVIPPAGQTAAAFQVSSGQEPGAMIPAVSGDRIIWTQQAGGAYQVRFNDVLLGQGGVVVDQMAVISDMPSLDGSLAVWASNPLGNYDLYCYYFPLRPGETDVGPQVRGVPFQLTYSSNDQINPSHFGTLVAYQEQTPTGWEIRYGRLAGVPGIVVEEDTGTPDDDILEFGNVSQGIPKTLPLTIRNIGTDDTLIYDLTLDDARLGLTLASGAPFTSNYLLPLGQTVDLLITCTPVTGNYDPLDATLTIDSDDPDDPTIIVTITGTIIDPPDLTPGPISIVPDPAIGGEIVTLSVDVDNIGLGDAGAFDWQFYLDGQAIGPLGLEAGGLAGGATVLVQADVRLDVLLDGLHDFDFQVDVSDLVEESDETNNWSTTFTTDVTPAWDPQPTDLDIQVSVPPDLRNSEPFTLTADLFNAGRRTTPAFEYAYYFSWDATIDPATASTTTADATTDMELFRAVSPSLAPNGTFTDGPRQFVLNRSDLPPGPYPQTCYIAIVTDPSDFLLEKDESNNELLIPVQVQVLNHPPVLTTGATLTGASVDTPFTITYAMLAAQADESDPDGDAVCFIVETVIDGTLTKGGTPVLSLPSPVPPGLGFVPPAENLLCAGEDLEWTPPPGFFGTTAAFTLKAWDGELPSETPAVQVNISVDVGDTPPFFGTEDQSVTITFAQLAPATGYPGADHLRFDTILSGTMTMAGWPVVSGDTLYPGESVVWTPDPDVNGPVDGFTVTPCDPAGVPLTALTSDAVTVNFELAPVNDQPTVTDLYAATERDEPITLNLGGTDVETAYDDLDFTPADPQHGTLEPDPGTPGQYIYTPDPGFLGRDSFTYFVTDTGDPDGGDQGWGYDGPLTSGTGTVRIQVGQPHWIEFWQGHNAQYYDASGDLVTATLKGPGRGGLLFYGTGRSDAVELVLDNTTLATSVVIKTKGRGVETTLGDIKVQNLQGLSGMGSLKMLTAKTTSLINGDLFFTGCTYGIVLNSVQNGQIAIGSAPADFRKGTKIVLGSVKDTSVVSGCWIKSLTAVEWLDTDGAADTVQAPWIQRMNTKGNRRAGIAGHFQADLDLSGTGAGSFSLTSARIAGDLSGPRDGDGDLLRNIEWDIGGGMGMLRVLGTARGATVRTTGSMRNVTVGASFGSDFLAGVDDESVDRHPAAEDDFLAPPAEIRSFRVTGLRGEDRGDRFFYDSNISAAAIGSVKLLNADIDDAGTPSGVYALSAGGIKSVRWVDRLDPSLRGVYPKDSPPPGLIISLI